MLAYIELRELLGRVCAKMRMIEMLLQMKHKYANRSEVFNNRFGKMRIYLLQILQKEVLRWERL